jgi:hypothetical protein
MRPSLSHTISIKLLPSKLLLGLIAGLSIIACLILLYLPILFLIKLVAITVIVASSVYYSLRDALLVLHWSWQLVEVDSKGQLTLLNQRGETFMPDLYASSYVHASLCILNFKCNLFKRALPPVILLTHAQNAEQLRRFRVWLRWFRSDEKNYGVLSDKALDF